MQRLRITFARGEAVKYLSHLELMRLWERVLRRAGWRISYSRGFTPRAKISFAAALPVGVAGEAELVEVQLEERRDLEAAASELSRQMPIGLEVRRVEEVAPEAPNLQREMVAAEYRADCGEQAAGEVVRASVQRVLAAESIARERTKEGKRVVYDLRPMIRFLEVRAADEGRTIVRMELRADAQGAGRPDEVLRELGLDPADCRITRTRLLLTSEG